MVEEGLSSQISSAIGLNNTPDIARRVPPFHATHIGSLLRPPHLLNKQADFRAKLCSKEDLKVAEDHAIRSAVAMQRRLGYRDITDGEFRRNFFYDGFFDALEGMILVPDAPLSEMESYLPFIPHFLEAGITTLPSYFCTNKIRRPKEGFYLSQFEFLTSLLPPSEVKYAKITMCPPEWMYMRYGSRAYDKTVYKNDDEYFADLAKVYRQEIRDLYDLGCRNIQIDSPTFCFLLDSAMEASLLAKGSSVDAHLSIYINALNACLVDIKRPSQNMTAEPHNIDMHMSDMTVGIHICRGNFKKRNFVKGGYDKIAKRFLTELKVDCFYMEYDSDSSQAETFESLKYLPEDKTVVLGLVSTKRAQPEEPEELKRRIHEAADWICKGNPARTKEVALSQLRLSPQCGFASFTEGHMTELEQKKKLELVAQVAENVWGIFQD